MSYVAHILEYQTVATSLSSSGILLGKWSGIFVNRLGYVLTNKHVVADLQAHYAIEFVWWAHFSVLHIRLHPSLDMALIQLSGTQEQFARIPLPHLLSQQKFNGNQSVIIANSSWMLLTSVMIPDWGIYRIDRPVLPGSSGSPLWNLSGFVIGMMMATTSESSLALPLSDPFVSEWISSVGK